ncbi:DUF3592 domain-containing protein [Tahibacter sp.]|uniref:DUF3592 domain-containing protein n=1 Tax=Tahibacter sp. TaxID=2056211 RepID=UPI0028C4E92C|nr:DUF3592 domain-containing protein [Tahibacter sp.]
MMNTVSLLMALVLCGGGIFMSVLFGQRVRLRVAMAGWPRIRGIVREHQVHAHRNLHGTGHHRPIVVVECASAGRKWIVRCDSPTRIGFATRQTALSSMGDFAIGRSVEIYIDPKNPQRAFLGPPEISALLLLSLGSLLLLAVGVGVLKGTRM